MLLLHLFFFNDTATTEIYTLSLHDALPISQARVHVCPSSWRAARAQPISSRQTVAGLEMPNAARCRDGRRSEEHTSELQSRGHLVCRLLLEKKKKIKTNTTLQLYKITSIIT